MLIDNFNVFLLGLRRMCIDDIFQEGADIKELKVERTVYLFFFNVQDIPDKQFAVIGGRLNTVQRFFLVFRKIRNVGLQDLRPHFYAGERSVQIM